jgi:hypothetical protein
MTTSDQEEEQAERRRVLVQDADLRRQQQASTFLAQTHIDDAGGRFAAVNAAIIVGSEPVVKYPQLPENNPWRSDPVPDEPPLGYRIDAMPELEPSSPAAQVTDDPANAPSGGSLVQQPSGGLVSERAGSSFSSETMAAQGMSQMSAPSGEDDAVRLARPPTPTDAGNG